MARPQSVVGIDVGRHTLKALVVDRLRSGGCVIRDGATREIFAGSDGVVRGLRFLLRNLDSAHRPCAVAVSGLDSFVRIIRQPPTPPELLREGLRLNGISMLNQDCQGYVLDCCAAGPARAQGENGGAPPSTGVREISYVVAGIPRARVAEVVEAFARVKAAALSLQPCAVALFNAFDHARPDVCAGEAFALLDVGHVESTVIVGRRHELVLVRSIGFGGDALLETLTGQGAVDRPSAVVLLEQGDIGLLPLVAESVSGLAHEIIGSVRFFEEQVNESIQRVFVSGGPSGSQMFLQVLSDCLDLPCELWDPLAQCESRVRRRRRTEFEQRLPDFAAAFGAALAGLDVSDGSVLCR